MNFKRATDFNRVAEELEKIRESLKCDSTDPDVPRLLAIARTQIELAELVIYEVADRHV